MMSTASRWYAYLVSFISLQAIVWALIALGRLLLASGGVGVTDDPLALNVAIVVIALPIYLGHWLWARRQPEERASLASRLYLYVVLGVLLVPILANAYDLLAGLLALPFPDTPHWRGEAGIVKTSLLHTLVALIVLGVFWAYHRLVLNGDARMVPDTGATATIRRLYLLLFSANGLTMTIFALIGLLTWLLAQFPLTTQAIRATTGWTDNLALLLVGVALFRLCWGQAQWLFASGQQAEEQSLLRKLYLYAVLFISALATVTSLTIFLAELLRRGFGLPPGTDLRLPFTAMLVLALVWIYHAVVLREDTQQAEEAPRQANIRRLYWYLVAAIGLSAFVIGLAGVIGHLINLLADGGFGEALFEQLAWSIAALLVGLLVWVVPWRAAQHAADADTPAGEEERASLVRRVYLYLFLFVAAVTVLANLVAIAYHLLTLGLGGGETDLISTLASAVANTLIGVGLWAYHLGIARADARTSVRREAERRAAIRIVILDAGDGQFGRAVAERLGRELPDAMLRPIGLTQTAAGVLGAEPAPVMDTLADATLIIAPWYVVSPGAAEGTVTPEVAHAVQASPAQKLLVPLPAPAYAWVGVDRWNFDLILRQLTQAARAVRDGRPISYTHPMSGCAIIGIIIAVLLFLLLLAIPVMAYFLFTSR